MLKKKIAFIGPGVMAEAMIAGLLRKQLAKAENIETIRKEMIESRTDLIKYMFLLWTGQIMAIFALAIWFWK